MFTWTLIKRIIGILLIVGGLAVYGMNGLLGGMVLNAWIAFFINAWLVDKHIGYKLKKQMKDLLPIFILAAVSILPAYLVTQVVNVNLYVDSIAMFLVFIMIYVGASILFKVEAFTYCKSFIPMIKNKIRKKK